ncbi:unnamed protein product [Thelazia callipaeda]|uniref:Activin_recp domain-containing protein n=1 Tax=Thelazia callipaeda TaxID=103827 RepID=A0A0N5CJA2_THECL|nr:unnamed protein product [Thelazia callipaeda]
MYTSTFWIALILLENTGSTASLYCYSYDKAADDWFLRAIPLDSKCYSLSELQSRINCSIASFENGCFMDPNYNSYKRSSAKLPVCICSGSFCNTQDNIESIWLQQNIYTLHEGEDCDGKKTTSSLQVSGEKSTTVSGKSATSTENGNETKIKNKITINGTSTTTISTTSSTEDETSLLTESLHQTAAEHSLDFTETLSTDAESATAVNNISLSDTD